jgi:hypothetical protein
MSCPCCGHTQLAPDAPVSDAVKIAALERALENERTLLRGTIRRVTGLRSQLDAMLVELETWHRARRAIGTNQ